jgi:regulator of cell morphogenesis and NO signaling
VNITGNTKVGDVATQYPLATRVFARHSIDFCCGGGKPLSEACMKVGVQVDTVLAEIDKEISTTDRREERWDEKSVELLIEHLLVEYHRPLDEELPRLEALARKVNGVHGEKEPEMLGGILSTFMSLRAELEQHMAKEEQILFPMIKSGQGAMAEEPVAVMEQEHVSAGAALKRLRELTNNFEVPEEACNSWRALWVGLEAFEKALHEHIHLENNILFPRALQAM